MIDRYRAEEVMEFFLQRREKNLWRGWFLKKRHMPAIVLMSGRRGDATDGNDFAVTCRSRKERIAEEPSITGITRSITTRSIGSG